MDAKIKKWKSCIKEKEDKYITAFQRNGIAGLSESLVQELSAWKNEKINIAILGGSGAGKSSLVNAILGLNGDDKGAAKVENITTSTSKSIESYAHPNNKQFMIWDFPGVGTKNFPKESYLERINFATFDFFIIVASKRFSENDMWLAGKIKERKKYFYFVRTKAENDVDNEWTKKKRKEPKESVRERVKDAIIADCKKNLYDIGCHDLIFVIDSYERDLYDFNFLQLRILTDAWEISERKQDAITLSLSAMTIPAIEEKKMVLEKRIFSVALRAAFTPSINDAVVRILEEEEEFYRNQFNLDAKSLTNDANASNTQAQLSDIERQLRMEKSKQQEEIHMEFGRLLPFLIPFFNIFWTYKVGKTWLKKALDTTVESAIEVNKSMLKGLARC